MLVEQFHRFIQPVTTSNTSYKERQKQFTMSLTLPHSLSCLPLAAPVMHPDSLLRLWSYINHLLTYTSYPATVRQLTCYGTLENVGIILTIDKTINISLTVNTDRQHVH